MDLIVPSYDSGAKQPRSGPAAAASPRGRGPMAFVQIHDDREAVQVSPDELPAIDIHSL